MLSEVQRYTDSIRDGSRRCGLEACPRCRAETRFSRHDSRSRTFLVVVERLVIGVASFVVRWTCSRCGSHVPDYPAFALPYKRYVTSEILERSQRFLEGDVVSYENSAEEEGLAVFYQGEGDLIDDRHLHASTVHRWISFLGSLVVVLQETQRLVREADATSTLFREVVAFPPRKYRSDSRRKLLGRALRLIAAAKEFRRAFSRDVFPNFAIASGEF